MIECRCGGELCPLCFLNGMCESCYETIPQEKQDEYDEMLGEQYLEEEHADGGL